MYSNHESVLLPGEDYIVMLKPILARGFVALTSAGEKGVTLEEIEKQCGASPSNVISRLRASGALILTIPGPFTANPEWIYIERETRYRYLAWNPRDPNRYPFSKKKES